MSFAFSRKDGRKLKNAKKALKTKMSKIYFLQFLSLKILT